MTISFACIGTPHARRYVAELSQIWPHANPATAPMRVEISFPIGKCELAATTRLLNITLAARSRNEVEQLEDLIAETLDAISGGETFHFQWIRPPSEESVSRHAA